MKLHLLSVRRIVKQCFSFATRFEYNLDLTTPSWFLHGNLRLQKWCCFKAFLFFSVINSCSLPNKFQADSSQWLHMEFWTIIWTLILPPQNHHSPISHHVTSHLRCSEDLLRAQQTTASAISAFLEGIQVILHRPAIWWYSQPAHFPFTFLLWAVRYTLWVIFESERTDFLLVK